MAKTDQLVEALCERLVSAAPAGWTRISLGIWASVLAYQFEATVTMADGSTSEIEIPGDLTQVAADLRAHMYEPGRGTWFSARCAVRRGHGPEATFNFDENPNWWPYVPPTVFSRDLEAFPRNEEHIPAWLQEVLAEAAA